MELQSLFTLKQQSCIAAQIIHGQTIVQTLTILTCHINSLTLWDIIQLTITETIPQEIIPAETTLLATTQVETTQMETIQATTIVQPLFRIIILITIMV